MVENFYMARLNLIDLLSLKYVTVCKQEEFFNNYMKNYELEM